MSRRPVPEEFRDDDDDDAAFPGTGTAAARQNTANDPRADATVAEAEKLIGGFSLFGKADKYDQAYEKLIKAAAMYKMNKNWDAAGDTYVRAAELSEKQRKEPNDALTQYQNAGKAYKNSNPKKAMRYFQITTNMLMENNRFSSAAKIWKDVGELYEKDMQPRQAAEAYEKAATCYEAEDSKANAGAMKIKVAQLAAEAEDYKKAIEIYEQVAKQALDTNVGRWSVTSYLFKALLCQFAISAEKHDLIKLENKLEKYKDMHPQLDGTRECKLVENCIDAFTQDDVDKYTDEVMRFDEILKLDNWTAGILLKVKQALQGGGDTGSADAEDLT